MSPRILARLNAGRTGTSEGNPLGARSARPAPALTMEPMAKRRDAVVDGTPQYKAESIQVLKGLEAVRKRPGMYIGSTSENGLHHLVYEVVDNSIDEALAGHCDTINVTIHADNSITVQDNGRGIPVDMHPTEKKPGGRGSADRAARGRQVRQEHLQGVRRPARRRRVGGERAVRAAGGRGGSRRQVATAWRSCAARPSRSSRPSGKARGTGTIIRFKPDPEIFTVLEFHYSTLADRLRQLAFLNKGVSITIKDERRGPEEGGAFFAKGGLVEFVAVAQPEQEAAPPQADRVQRHQGRRRGGPGPAVRGRVQREHLHLREQHQHPRGRHPPHRIQVGAHPHDQRRRQEARLPQEGGLHPLRRGHPRGTDLRAAREGAGAPVRGADQDQAGQLRGRGHRQDGRERAPRQLSRRAPAGCAEHHREGGAARRGPARPPARRATWFARSPDSRTPCCPASWPTARYDDPAHVRDLPGRGRLRRRQRQAGTEPRSSRRSCRSAARS